MDSCRAVHHFVTERDIPAVCYHGDMPIPERKEAMLAFAGKVLRFPPHRSLSMEVVEGMSSPVPFCNAYVFSAPQSSTVSVGYCPSKGLGFLNLKP